MKKRPQPIKPLSGQSDPNLGQAGAMMSTAHLKKIADSLWMPSAIEDAHFEAMRRRNEQSGVPKRHIDLQGNSE